MNRILYPAVFPMLVLLCCCLCRVNPPLTRIQHLPSFPIIPQRGAFPGPEPRGMLTSMGSRLDMGVFAFCFVNCHGFPRQLQMGAGRSTASWHTSIPSDAPRIVLLEHYPQ